MQVSITTGTGSTYYGWTHLQTDYLLRRSPVTWMWELTSKRRGFVQIIPMIRFFKTAQDVEKVAKAFKGLADIIRLQEEIPTQLH